MGGHDDLANKCKAEGISVFVRIRPASVCEEADHGTQVLSTNHAGTCVSVRNAGQPRKSVECTFDRVFSPASTQGDVFAGLVPTLDTVLQGFNACVLAYGQTGSGKTHTLIGPGGGAKLSENPAKWGVIPRAVQFLFDRLAAISDADETFAYTVACSYLQIYNENLVDLLQEGGHCGSVCLQIREESTRQKRRCGDNRRRGRHGRNVNNDDVEDVGRRPDTRAGMRPSALHENRRVFVNGLSSFRVSGAQDVLRYINIGAANRTVRATQHNEASSRSHAIMQLMVEVESGGGGDRSGDAENAGTSGEHLTYRQAKLSLVDLAGSEKMDSMLTVSRGHFNELRSINQSLSALGNVVSALTEKGRTHVPYRDSKLTRLLQDSLGGNTRTTIIACVSPVAAQTNETISTLQFADRAKHVTVRLTPNEVVDDRVLLARARAEIVRLKQLLRQALDNSLRGPRNVDDAEAFLGKRRLAISDGTFQRDGDVGRAAEKGNAAEEAGYAPISLPTHDRKLPTDELSSYLHDFCEATDASKTKETAAAAAGISSAMSTVAIQKRQTLLVDKKERLRDANERLKATVHRLIARERERQKQKRRHRREHSSSRMSIVGRDPLSSSPVEWSARYADAADTARRRRTLGSRTRSSTANPDQRESAGTRSASPAVATRLLLVAASNSGFRRREFGDDGIDGLGSFKFAKEREMPGFSATQFPLNAAEGETDNTMGFKAESDEEDERGALDATRRLEAFRSELDRVSLCGGGGGVAAAAARGGPDVTASRDEMEEVAIDEKLKVVWDEEVMRREIHEFQRLEDLMFEAQGRERQRVREESARLAAVQAERLALETELTALSSGTPAHVADAARTPPNLEYLMIDTQATTSQAAEKGGQAADGRILTPRVHGDGAIAPFAGHRLSAGTDGAIAVQRNQTDIKRCAETNRIADAATAAPITPAVDSAVSTTTEEPYRREREEKAQDVQIVRGTKNTATIARESRRKYALSIPLLATQKTGWTTPPPRQWRSPSRWCRATSGGAVVGRARSWRTRGGGKEGGRDDGRSSSQSPTRDIPEMNRLNIRDCRPEKHDGKLSAVERRNDTLKQVSAAASTMTSPSPAKAKFALLRNTYPTSSFPDGSTPLPRNNSNWRATAGDGSSANASVAWTESIERKCHSGSGSDGGDRGVGKASAAASTRLSYSLADLGLRLTVYSFRYDHHYECQVVGYDARRRMHRCAYYATGEKQWHDLRTKRFEVVGQNRVALRSTESAPQPVNTPSPPQASAVR